MAGDLDAIFPKASACKDAGDVDPGEDDSLEQRGLRRVAEEKTEKREKFRGEGSSVKALDYFEIKRVGDTVSFVKKMEQKLPTKT